MLVLLIIGIICTVGIVPEARAVQSIYCPQNHGYINVGMTTDQVIAACGQPLVKKQSRTLATAKVPVTQLIYNSQGAPTAFYGVWSLRQGINTGVRLTFEIIDNKVHDVNLNGSGTNAVSTCGGSIQAGDPITKVYSLCGNPSMVNTTYITQAIPSDKKPEMWTYQANQYQNPFTLTFIDGELFAIDDAPDNAINTSSPATNELLGP